jgi:hypothetical protein
MNAERERGAPPEKQQRVARAITNTGSAQPHGMQL